MHSISLPRLESEFACIDGYGKFKQQGIDECTRCPYAHRDKDLGYSRSVFIDLSQGVRHKAGDYESHAFLDVDTGNNKDAGHIERCEILPRPRKKEKEEGRDIQESRKPYIGDQLSLSMEAEVEVFHGIFMNSSGVEDLKGLCTEKEKVNRHSVGDQFSDLKDRTVIYVHIPEDLPDDLEYDEHYCRT